MQIESSKEIKSLGSLGFFLVVVFSSFAVFAASISGTTSNAGQGVALTEGYSMGPVKYGGEWLTQNNSTNTNVTQFAFILKASSDGIGESTVTNTNTAV